MLKLAILLAAVAVCSGLTKYSLFTRKNVEFGANLDVTASDKWLDLTNLDPEHKTIILIHGHQGRALDDFTRRTRNEIFTPQTGDVNIILVDWERSASYNYATATANVQLVANELTNFMKLLTELEEPVKLPDLHLVGFGLGAHVAGIAGRQIRYLPLTETITEPLTSTTTQTPEPTTTQTPEPTQKPDPDQTTSLGMVGRITGLDPAGSRWGSDSGRLRVGDASYVEVIHTDGSGVLANGIGTNIGQINFYANGGSNQPGCLTHSCSHNRAWELFAASMINNNLRGNACSSMTQMNLNLCRGTSLVLGGLAMSKSGTSSIYRINTGRNYPFGN